LSAPRHRKGDEWKPLILRATIELIHERGVAELSLAEIAAAAGTSAPTLIYYFGNKNDLIHDALKLADDDFWNWLHAKFGNVVDPVERLCLLFSESVAADWALSMDLWSYSLRTQELAGAHREFDGRTRTAISSIIQDGVQAGTFPSVDIDAVALRLSCLMDGLAVHVALNDADVRPGRMVDCLLQAAALELSYDLETLQATAKRVRTSRRTRELQRG
jgi:AcrR family transcriptional regulator